MICKIKYASMIVYYVQSKYVHVIIHNTAVAGKI